MLPVGFLIIYSHKLFFKAFLSLCIGKEQEREKYQNQSEGRLKIQEWTWQLYKITHQKEIFPPALFSFMATT